MNLQYRVNVKTVARVRKQIEMVQFMKTISTNKEFQEYIKRKFLDTVKEISNVLGDGDVATAYKNNHKIRDIANGFVLYNDTTVATDSEGYGGEFAIALLFEYGSGVVGQENPKLGAWQYNVNEHTNGWYYFKNDKLNWTAGQEGREIYRQTQEVVKNNLSKWLEDFLKNEVKK